jgi:hypothetical protein
MYLSRNAARLPKGSAALRKAANFESLAARAGRAIQIAKLGSKLNSRSWLDESEVVPGRYFDYIKLLATIRLGG